MQKFTKIGLFLLSLCLLVLSTPGYNYYLLSYFALIPFFYAINSLELRKAIFYTYVHFTFFYMVTLSWIVITISDFGNAPKLVGIILLFLFSSYLALYWMIFVFVFKKGFNIVLISAIFTILEIIKSWFLTGFPWLNLGITQYNNPFISKLYSFIGELGVSFILVLINLSLFYFFTNKRAKYLYGILIFIFLVVFANIVPVNNKQKLSYFKIATIQPSYSQKDKWDPDKKEQLIDNVLKMYSSLQNNYDLIVFPESVFPTFCNEDDWILNYLTSNKKSEGVIFGCLRYEGKEKIKYYNSVYFLKNNNYEYYDKIHLVPFGEYFPLKSIFKPIEYYFFQDAEDFSSGNEYKIFKLSQDVFIATPLCYESAYSSLVRRFLDKGTNLLVFLSNDSWFGKSKGRYQHLAIDIIRSYEFNKSVVRATQSGISACINPLEKGVVTLGISKKGVLKCDLPIIDDKTFFERVGYNYLIIIIILSLLYEIIKRNLLIKLFKKGNKN